jgi:predicted small lipoprotein YifL
LSFSRTPRLALFALALLALAGCGRRGELEPPSAALATPAPENRHRVDFHRPDPKIAPPKKDFVLDPVLQ